MEAVAALPVVLDVIVLFKVNTGVVVPVATLILEFELVTLVTVPVLDVYPLGFELG